MGRVYKDQWEKAISSGDAFLAKAYLKKAIETYLEGFEADWRDAYPGINAVTLMEVADDARRHELIPVVRYSVERRLARKAGVDYWDYATRLEVAVLADDMDASAEALGMALSASPPKWQLETTARNIRLIVDARSSRRGGETGANLILAELLEQIEKPK